MKYRVYMFTTASTTVEVEADTQSEAIDAAFESSLPYAPAFSGFDLGEWSLGSEMYPETYKLEDDAELVDE
jgi:hypothetical protein